ncbi:class I SAM-dependent methyltransferase [Candidatus Pelagibacter sp.]|nr:class I SAM-dependent methyltransferase [Candidatus Pelagibacter sp.]
MKKFLDLGLQPLANSYLESKDINKKEKKFRLQVAFNPKNYLVSILNTVSKEKMFNENYPYKSSESLTMRKAFKKFSKNIKRRFKPKTILEIGSNDGAFLKNFSKKEIVGVEPCKNLARITKKKGYKTFSDYWSPKLAKKITKNKKIDLIYSANTLSHIKNFSEIFRAINLSLNKTGILILEDPSLLECIKKTAYDQFYCEHIYVFSSISLQRILGKYNLEIFDIENTSTHGGSNRYFIKRKLNKYLKISKNVTKNFIIEKKNGLHKISTYKKFAKRVLDSKIRLNKIFDDLIAQQKKIVGYGATAKSCTVLNYCKIKRTSIKFFYDTTSFKINKYLPGTKIKIKKYKKLATKDVDYAFLGAWNFKDEIFKKEREFIKNGGKFITHVPYPKIL